MAKRKIRTPIEPQSDENIDKQDVPFHVERQKMSYQEDQWFFWVRVGFLVFSSFLTVAVVTIFLWHLVAPSPARWLPEADLAKIKDVALAIIVGLVMSGATTYFFKKKK